MKRELGSMKEKMRSSKKNVAGMSYNLKGKVKDDLEMIDKACNETKLMDFFLLSIQSGLFMGIYGLKETT